MGHWMRATATRHGYATETARALTEAGFTVPGVVRLEIHIDPANRTSACVPAKLGYTTPGPCPATDPAERLIHSTLAPPAS